MTLNGKVIYSLDLPYNENRINWDGRLNNGNFVDSGIYLIVVENSQNINGIVKLAVIR